MDSILLQKQVRDNSEELRSYLKDLTLWEDEMKRKEGDLKDSSENPEVCILFPSCLEQHNLRLFVYRVLLRRKLKIRTKRIV